MTADKKLKGLLMSERFEILLYVYRNESDDFKRGLELGFKTGLSTGYQQIAPAWVDEYFDQEGAERNGKD